MQRPPRRQWQSRTASAWTREKSATRWIKGLEQEIEDKQAEYQHDNRGSTFEFDRAKHQSVASSTEAGADSEPAKGEQPARRRSSLKVAAAGVGVVAVAAAMISNMVS